MYVRKFIVSVLICSVCAIALPATFAQAGVGEREGSSPALQAGFGKSLKRALRKLTAIFTNKKAEPAPVPPPAVAPVTPSPVLQESEILPGTGSAAGSIPARTGGSSGRNLAPTRSSNEGGTGASTVFEGQRPPAGGASQSPIGGGGIGESAPAQTANAYPTKIILETPGNLQGIKEGDGITFKAMLLLSDGTKKDVTREAQWKVLGPIGSIESAGVFRAKLDSLVSELGEGNGSLVVTWQDSVSGSVFFDNTPVFRVEAYFQDAGPQEGRATWKNLFGTILKIFIPWSR